MVFEEVRPRGLRYNAVVGVYGFGGAPTVDRWRIFGNLVGKHSFHFETERMLTVRPNERILRTISTCEDGVPARLGISQFSAFGLPNGVNVRLSLATHIPLAHKDQSRECNIDRGRLTVQQHFERIFCEAGLPTSGKAVMAVSCRNALSNFRCGAWVRGVTPKLLTVQDEDCSKSRRPYHFLGFKDGRFAIDEGFADTACLERFDWAVSGVPVYWDGEAVYDRMLAEISDFSHVFKLPRGADPSATEESLSRWRHLQQVATECLYLPRSEAVRRIRQKTEGMIRQDAYLHNCAGVTPEGQLVIVIANGRLERIGEQLADLGATRAIVLDNGGSSSVFYFRNGADASGVQLVGAPNFRPAGTAYFFAVLKEDRYCSLSALAK
jgi:hypothetical protein